MFLLLLLHLFCLTSAAPPSPSPSPSPPPPQALPGCQEECGGIKIPYPFGVGEGCYRAENEWYRITCNQSFSPPKPFIGSGNLQIIEASLETVLVQNWIASLCYNKSDGSIDNLTSQSVMLYGTPYTFSYTRNRFIVLGCDSFALFQGSKDVNFTSGCISLCASTKSVVNGSCSGIGCCQTDIPRGLKRFAALVRSINNHSESGDFNPCSYAFLGDSSKFSFSVAQLTDKDFVSKTKDAVPLVLDWAVGNQTCEQARKNSTSFACGTNTNCSDSTNGPGYRCSCLPGYEGNPYLLHGCQDINECERPSTNDCTAKCINSEGSYSCNCPSDSYGDGRRSGSGCTKKKKSFPALQLIIGVSLGLLFLLFASSWIYWVLKKRKLMKLREKFFKQNGGLLLQQQISLRQGATDTSKIFSSEELEKATNRYDQSRIIGRGGYGTVYKGILSDGRVVAIKRSKIVDETQIEQFINEVAILSQVNHRNVVKLLGCCLETEVPLLVYEYVPNGTLFHHLHDEGHVSSLSWENRLRIATETAGALAYLHSAASVPIFHRDIKSANILLDDNYTARVSDFGASRLVPMDKAELTTLVQGTLGYLDPEYLLTSQLTEKSDVYSFGVVLVELLTGKTPLSFDRSEEQRNLSMYFILSMKENFLFQILDPRVVAEGIQEQILAVAELAKRCLKVKGDERPTMKEVATELEGLRRFRQHPWVQQNAEEMESLLGEQLDYNGGDTTGYDSLNMPAIIEIDMPR
ncbi:hypothetical protein ACLOJK_038901 [Asimina triloba]